MGRVGRFLDSDVHVGRIEGRTCQVPYTCVVHDQGQPTWLVFSRRSFGSLGGLQGWFIPSFRGAEGAPI